MFHQIPLDKLKINRNFSRSKYINLRNKIKKIELNTVCVSANCPNRYECFSSGTATFMILGNKCTWNCKYCDVDSGIPISIDDEPVKIAKQVYDLNLEYVVITSVTRDDLPDGGASVFADCICEIKKCCKNISVEVLVPDMFGSRDNIAKIIFAGPRVFNHNIEVVRNLFLSLRPKGNYDRSLEVLRLAKELDGRILVKSGLMVGFGESMDDIFRTLDDLRSVGCNLLTVGQYFAPSRRHAKMVKLYSEAEFDKINKYAISIGFDSVMCGVNVRSSYKAGEMGRGII